MVPRVARLLVLLGGVPARVIRALVETLVEVVGNIVLSGLVPLGDLAELGGRASSGRVLVLFARVGDGAVFFALLDGHGVVGVAGGFDVEVVGPRGVVYEALPGPLPGLESVDGANTVLVERDDVQRGLPSSGGSQVVGDAEGVRGVEVVGELGALPGELVYDPSVWAVDGLLRPRLEAEPEDLGAVQAPCETQGEPRQDHRDHQHTKPQVARKTNQMQPSSN